MSKESIQDRDALTQRVRASLQKAEKIISGHRKTNTRLVVTGMTSSAASTLVAGITAVQGPIVGEGTEGWRIACIIMALD